MTGAALRHIEEDPARIGLDFGGQHFEALLSGALYWPEEETLLVADLHLEKMSSFARSRQFLPPYDTRATLKRLAADIAETRAKRVICLGDSFHRDEGTETLLEPDREALDDLTSGIDWVWLAGNHDPAAHELGGTCCENLAMAGLTLSHIPEAATPNQIAGHLHPAARIRRNGRSVRRACFAFDTTRLILPAYGVSTGSLNILSPAFDGLLKRSALNVVMLGQGRVYAVAPRYLVGG
ncbi:ligase-associated DNA damage response endonuclease PdeM [Cucumibacter marinus]|uniref:ligase-associated DNA damage response endonuclease PdeM n=1 Tax=Cucumibacter marinus TaxID=1121252 RepID=UPI00041C25FE|nr:ligase-associated DNA damage response endonuclease PdeM [Cucumibacter marinus]